MLWNMRGVRVGVNCAARCSDQILAGIRGPVFMDKDMTTAMFPWIMVENYTCAFTLIRFRSFKLNRTACSEVSRNRNEMK